MSDLGGGRTVDTFVNAREVVASKKRRHPEIASELDRFDRWLSSLDLRAAAERLAAPMEGRYRTKKGAYKGRYKGKYLDIAKHVVGRIRAARALGLHELPSSRILDIGAGCGFFCYAVSLFGHEAIALQPPGQRGRPYHAMLEFFGIPNSPQLIKPREPIQADDKLAGRFDRVTAFAIMFNRLPGGIYWEAEDYLFFLSDLRDNWLTPDGRVVLDFHGSLYDEREQFSPARNRYYNAVGELLRPFRVSYDFETGVVLDLFRGDAWAEARKLTLPQFRIEDNATDNDQKRNRMNRRRADDGPLEVAR